MSEQNAPGENAPASPGAPLCYLADNEPGVRRLVESAMARLSVEIVIFDTLAELLDASTRRAPDLIVVDITVGGSARLDMIAKLVTAKLACPIQIVSGLNPILIEQVRRIGERNGLTMLPVKHKPLQSSTLNEIVTSLGLRRDAQTTVKVGLEEILSEGWLELWYQPTIGLQHRNMVGAEAFVRARHPDHGVLTPDMFLPGASETALLDLTRRVLGRAMGDWPVFATIGAPIELSINVPLVAMKRLSIFGIMWEEKPDSSQWPGLTLEISEEEVVGNFALVTKAIAELRTSGISVAVDNFGPAYSEFSRLPDLPFKEIKIDRGYIASCDTDPVNRGLCETIIEFGRKFQLTTCAEGIETVGELNTLREIGCDVGQGYLFARPMPRNQLVDLLRQRSKKRPAA